MNQVSNPLGYHSYHNEMYQNQSTISPPNYYWYYYPPAQSYTSTYFMESSSSRFVLMQRQGDCCLSGSTASTNNAPNLHYNMPPKPPGTNKSTQTGGCVRKCATENIPPPPLRATCYMPTARAAVSTRTRTTSRSIVCESTSSCVEKKKEKNETKSCKKEKTASKSSSKSKDTKKAKKDCESKSKSNQESQNCKKIELETTRNECRTEKSPAEKLNIDPDPIVITKPNKCVLEYVQELAVRYLRPPSPPTPGDIIIRESKARIEEPLPPLIIRQQPPRPDTPEPLVIREAPPNPPKPMGKKIITISGKQLPPPPRKVIVERLAPIPSKPQPVIIERWLPYAQRKRRVIYQRSNDCDNDSIVALKPKNVIIQWEPPKVILNKEIKHLGIIKADPCDYIKQHGPEIISSTKLPDFVKAIRPPSDVGCLAADFQNDYDQVELYGDVTALNLIDLEKEGLSEYKPQLEKRDSCRFRSSSPMITTTTTTTTTTVEVNCEYGAENNGSLMAKSMMNNEFFSSSVCHLDHEDDNTENKLDQMLSTELKNHQNNNNNNTSGFINEYSIMCSLNPSNDELDNEMNKEKDNDEENLNSSKQIVIEDSRMKSLISNLLNFSIRKEDDNEPIVSADIQIDLSTTNKDF